MAKLTVHQRNEIVDDILADTGVPARVDALRQRLINVFKDAYWVALPENIQALRGTPGEMFLKEKNVDVASDCYCVQAKLPYTYGVEEGIAAAAARANTAVKALHREYEAAVKEGKELKDLTRAYVCSCSTAAQFRSRFPELAKYLPRADVPVANLPATTEFTDRLKAAGLKLGE